MAGAALRMVWHGDDELSPPHQEHLLEIERRITVSESEGLRARWECGQDLLRSRIGKKLPIGLLENVAALLEVSTPEITKRMTFAKKFPTEDAFRNAITKWPSWYEMVKNGLPTKRAGSRAASPSLRSVVTRLRKMHATPDDADFLAAIQAELERLYLEVEGK